MARTISLLRAERMARQHGIELAAAAALHGPLAQALREAADPWDDVPREDARVPLSAVVAALGY